MTLASAKATQDGLQPCQLGTHEDPENSPCHREWNEMTEHSRHENYEVLNMIGYGLAKFDKDFVAAFGFGAKQALYAYLVQHGVAESIGVLKNRQDLFDPFFDNPRKGWWQKGDAYIHRKLTIDSLFGSLDATSFANMVKLYLSEHLGLAQDMACEISPVLKSRFRQLQVTGYEAELFFMSNYSTLLPFENGILEDARTLGDGYDFQITVGKRFYLAEIKGVRNLSGSIRMTYNEYEKAKAYKSEYALVVVSNLDDKPRMSAVFAPTESITFSAVTVESTQTTYHTDSILWH